MKSIDNFLNKITMYRLVLYCLSGWIGAALIFSFLHLLPFQPQALLYSTAVLLLVSWTTNRLFALIWRTHANVESFYITALILALIISPPAAGHYLAVLPFLVWAAVWSMATKFIVALNKKHVFNPAAFAVALTAVTIGGNATWWIGTLYMLPFVAAGGLMIVRKVRRFDLVTSFTVVALIAIFATAHPSMGVLASLQKIFVESPIVFFATVMLTEPLTTPPRRFMRVLYGALVGFLFAPNIHLGSYYPAPEVALLIGNVFSWLVSPKFKFMLTLKSKEKIAADTGEFVFVPDRAVSFKAGQYLEWTLDHARPDTRGNRRYFTIASSPTEKDIRLGVRFDAHRSSSFKKSLAELDEGATVMVGQLAGDFTLPRNPKKKLAFIAGGIGITPFRSMVGYLMDTGEARDIVLLYSVKTIGELAYTDIFNGAHERLRMKTVATLTDLDRLPPDWNGHRGFVDAAMIVAEIPDYLERTFYISGPHLFVDACTQALKGMGVPRRQIRIDYFPGF